MSSGYVDPPKRARAARKALEALRTKVDNIFVHFDVDVIDISDMPAADVPHPNGLSFSEAAKALKIFTQSDNFLGMEITEFNSDKDRDQQLATKLIKLIASALK